MISSRDEISRVNTLSEAVVRKCSVKNIFLEISQNSQENTCVRVSFLIKLQAACNFIKKETLAQVFSREFYKISKNTFFIKHLSWLVLYSFTLVLYVNSFKTLEALKKRYVLNDTHMEELALY